MYAEESLIIELLLLKCYKLKRCKSDNWDGQEYSFPGY